MKIHIAFAVLFLYAVCSQATELKCKYRLIDSFMRTSMFYECLGTIKTTSDDYDVTNIAGSHLSDKSGDDLDTVYINDSPMEVLPTNLRKFFKNYRGLSIANLPNYNGFNRSQFSDYTHLWKFSAFNLPKVEYIPKDTFYDMRNLDILHLTGFANVGSIDADLLVNSADLKEFYFRGPNKIKEIPQGLFRNQVRSLKVVDFSGSNLIKIGHNIFVNFNGIHTARFFNAGCLNRMYLQNVVGEVTNDIRSICEDNSGRNGNQIQKNNQKQTSSSSSSEN